MFKLVKTVLKEAMVVDFFGDSPSVFADAVTDSGKRVAHRDKFLNNVSVFEFKVFVFRCSHDKPPVKDA